MPVNLSLRSKGIVAVMVLIGYLALIALFLAYERAGLVSMVQEIEINQARAEMVEPVINALAHSVVRSQVILNAQESAQPDLIAGGDFSLHLEALNLSLENVRGAYPDADDQVEKFRRAAGAVKAIPAAHHLARVRDSEQSLLAKLQDLQNAVRRQSVELAEEYRSRQTFISLFAISANIVGAVASVAVILVFFTRLTNDIKRLEHRAAAIVGGYRGEPLRNDRSDELGGLIGAVNRMQADLRRREQQIEVNRQQRFHQEKMAAVGSLASAIGHEVSNPIAAISGVAQFIVDESRNDERPESRRIAEFAGTILRQAERIAHIMRELASLSAPRSREPELLDLNALVRSTCSFIRYDKRFDGIEFSVALDDGLPGVVVVADHIMQILMNLLINAADATEGAGARRIGVATHVATGMVELSVSDNGRGMTPDVLEKAFDESFTTKPAGKGRGIGLFVCKDLIEKAGGRIELSSVAGQGTTATIHIPLRDKSKGRR
jgi:signal transduction histidine kinase